MPTYRPIIETEVAVDAPLTQQLMQALKDNVLAIQEGDATASAVRITPQALTPPINVGDYRIGVYSGSYGGDSNTTITKLRFRLGGTFRFSGTHTHTDGGGIGGDDGSLTIRKYDASGNFVENLYNRSDSGGTSTYTISFETTIAAGGSIDAYLTAETRSSTSFSVGIGVDSLNVLGEAVFYALLSD